MGDEPSERTPEEVAREHEKIQREIENRARGTEGGLTPEDMVKIARQQTDEDYRRVVREQWQSGKLGVDLEPGPQPTESILDEIDVNQSSLGVMGLAPDEAPVLTGEMLTALKRPENMMRLVAAGLGIIGFLLLFLGLRAEANQTSGNTTGVATSLPVTATTTPPTTVQISDASVTGSAKATASFTKVSGPCNFARQFSDNFSFVATNGVLALTQLSNNHVTNGTIDPDGDFSTSADGQGYSGNVNGMTAEGQHTYTAEGCNEVYNFTMELYEPLIIPVDLTITTTTAPPTTTSTAVTVTSAPTTSSSGGRNIPLVALGLILLIGALGLYFGGPRLAGGPVIAEPRDGEDPCAKEKARLAAAERARDAADERYRQIEELERNAQSTQRDAAAKRQAATTAAQNASSYQGADGRTVYTNTQQRAQIEAAEAAAAAANQASAAAQRAYDAAGGVGGRQTAGDEMYRANREYGDAKASLDSCLRIHTAATPAPPQSSGGGSTTGGTMSGPLVATGTGSSTQTRERTCPNCGRTRCGVKPDSESSRTREITVNEINRAVITLDPTYPYAQLVPLTEFVEFMDGFRQAFKAAKAIHTVIDGTIVEGALDTIDATGIADVPDFLTYWDKLTEATLKGLKQTGDIFIDRFGKLGDYQLTFTRRIHTATCRTWEECDGTQWVRKREVKVEITRTERNCRTRTITVHDKREIADSINRLFTDLERENERGTRDLKTFEESCGR